MEPPPPPPPPSNTFVLRGRIDRATGPEVGVVLHGTWYDGAGGTFANTRFVHEQTPMGADGKPPDGLYMGRMTIATDKRRQIVDRMGLRFAAAAAADAGGGASLNNTKSPKDLNIFRSKYPPP